MWYDEEDPWYHLLDSKVDKANNTVSVTTTHFSTYLLVDKKQWKAAWDVILDYRGETNQANSFDIAFVLDESGSMYETPYKNVQEGTKYFIDMLGEKDRATVISFDDTAKCRMFVTNDKDFLKNAVDKQGSWGGTNIAVGIEEGITQLLKASTNSANKKIMILITDGYGSSDTQNAIKLAVENNINIFTIGIGTGVNSTLLELIAKETGGKYYQINSTDDLLNILYFIQNGTVADYDPTDNDNDGIPDVLETVGMRLTNGKIIYSNPKNDDSDWDTIKNGQEMVLVNQSISEENDTGKKIDGKPVGRYFIMYSHPEREDSDYDGLNDIEDPSPLQSHGRDRFQKVNSFDYKPGNYIVENNKRESDRVWNTVDNYDYLEIEKIHSNARLSSLAPGMPVARKFLNNYLGDNVAGVSMYIDYYLMNNFSECIEDTNNAKAHFRKNMNNMLQAAELMVLDNETAYVSTVNSVNGVIVTSSLSDVQEDPNWWFSVGNASGDMVGRIKRTGNKYTMELKYYVHDFYNWEKDGDKPGGFVTDGEMYILHTVGWAKQYEIEALVTTTISWSKGERLDENLRGVSMTKLKDIK